MIANKTLPLLPREENVCLLKERKLLASALITIWQNTYGCSEQYICASSIYHMSVMLQYYSVIIYRGIIETGHGKEVIGGLNNINNCFIYQIIYNVQLTGSKTFDSQILLHSFTQNNDVSLDKESQKHLSKEHIKHGVIDQVKYRKISSKRKWTYI